MKALAVRHPFWRHLELSAWTPSDDSPLLHLALSCLVCRGAVAVALDVEEAELERVIARAGSEMRCFEQEHAACSRQN